MVYPNHHADRLICYLTLMGIVARRLFMMTLVARTDPSLPCSQFLSEQEWTVLAFKSSRKGHDTNEPICVADALVRIAKLGVIWNVKATVRPELLCYGEAGSG